jgi:hypothetical protein
MKIGIKDKNYFLTKSFLSRFPLFLAKPFSANTATDDRCAQTSPLLLEKTIQDLSIV